MDALPMIAAASLGLSSIVHCAAMCGPLAAYAASGPNPRSSVGYHVGRLLSYGLLGGLVGALSQGFSSRLPGPWVAAFLSWTLSMAMGLMATRVWRSAGEEVPGEQAATGTLIQLGPRPIFLSDRVLRLLPTHPLSLGLVTALLPCGALYAAMLLAVSAATAISGVLTMVTFGAVSALGLVAVSAASTLARRLIERGIERQFLIKTLAAALMVGAVVFAIRPIAGLMAPEEPPACHVPSQ